MTTVLTLAAMPPLDQEGVSRSCESLFFAQFRQDTEILERRRVDGHAFATGIADCAISRYILPSEYAPLFFSIAVLVAVDLAPHRWPWLSADQFPAYIRAHSFSTFIYHAGIDPKKRQGCASGFSRNCAWQ